MTMTMKTTLAILVADTGVLFPSAVVVDALTRGGAGPFVAAPARRLSETCAKAVHCKNGFAFTDANFQSPVSNETSRTCVEECDGKCCVEGACDRGAFTVCADGSCKGMKACYGAGDDGAIGLISGGSCVGASACFRAGAFKKSNVGSITNGSCVGSSACKWLGSSGGSVGDITGGSCDGTQACYDAGGYFGSVGDITNGSCKGTKACFRFGYGKEGSVGDITNGSCVDEEACAYLGSKGEVGDVTGGSCDGTKACYKAGSYTGSEYEPYAGLVGDITDGSCVDKEACAYLGLGGEVGDVTSGSCNGEKACFMAGDSGKVGNITNGSCFGRYACLHLGYYNTSFVSSLESCCKGEEACQTVGCKDDVETECTIPPPDLPIDCSKPPDSLSDAPSILVTTAPSASPSEAPRFFPTTPPIDSPIDSPSSLTGCVPKGRFQSSCEEKNKKRSCAKELLCNWKNKQCVPICDNKRKKACRKPRFKNSRVCKFN